MASIKKQWFAAVCAALMLFTVSFQTLYAQSAIEKARNALGQIGSKTGLGSIDPTGDAGVYARLAGIINIVLGLIGVVAAIYLIHGGVKWMRSAGNEQDVTEAKEEIRAAIIGLMVIFLSYIVANYVVNRLIQLVK